MDTVSDAKVRGASMTARTLLAAGRKDEARRVLDDAHRLIVAGPLERQALEWADRCAELDLPDAAAAWRALADSWAATRST